MAEICIAASPGLCRHRSSPGHLHPLPGLGRSYLGADHDDHAHLPRQRQCSGGQSQLSRDGAGARGACCDSHVSGAGPSPRPPGGYDNDVDDDGQAIGKGRRRPLRTLTAPGRCCGRDDESLLPLQSPTTTTTTTIPGQGDDFPTQDLFCEALQRQLSALLSPYRCLTLQRRCLCGHARLDDPSGPDDLRIRRRRTSPEQRREIIREHQWKKQLRNKAASQAAMHGLPPGWQADHDGHRWFYRYRPTGHVQYRFPSAGDEFPEYVDARAPAPALDPEERRESQQQVRRQIAGRLFQDPDAGLPKPRMVATVERPVSLVWRADGGDDGEQVRVRRERENQRPDSGQYTAALRRHDAARMTSEKQGAVSTLTSVSPDSSGVASPHFFHHDVVKAVSRQPVPPPLSLSYDIVDRTRSHDTAYELPVNVSPQRPAFDPVGIVAEMPTDYTPASRFEAHPPPAEMAGSSVPGPLNTKTSTFLAELPGKTSPLERKPPVVIGPSRWSEDQQRAQQQAGKADRQHEYHPYVPGVIPNTHSTDRQRNCVASLQREVSLMMGVNSGTPPAEASNAVAGGLSGARTEMSRKPVNPAGLSALKNSGVLEHLAASHTQGNGTKQPAFPVALQPASGRVPLPECGQPMAHMTKHNPYSSGTESKQPASSDKVAEAKPCALVSIDVSPLQSRSGSMSSGNVMRTPSPMETSRSGSLNASLAQRMNGDVNAAPGLNETLSSILGGGPLHRRHPGPAVPKKIPLEPSDFAPPPANIASQGWSDKIYNQPGELIAQPKEKVNAPRYPVTEYPVGFQVTSNKVLYRAFAPSEAVSVPGAWPTQEQSDFRDEDSTLDMPHWQPPTEAITRERASSGSRVEKATEAVVSASRSATPRTRSSSIKHSSLELSPAAQKAILQVLTPSPSTSFRRRNSGASVKRDLPQQTPTQPAEFPKQEQTKESKMEVKSDLKPSEETPTPMSLHQLKKQAMPNSLGSYPINKSEPHLPSSVSVPVMDDTLATEKDKKWNKWFKGSKGHKGQSESAPKEIEEPAGLGITNHMPSPPPISLHNRQPGRKQDQRVESSPLPRPRTGHAGASPLAGTARASGALSAKGPARTHGRSVSDSTGAYTTMPGPKAPRAPSQLPRRSALPRLVNTSRPAASQNQKGMPVLVITSPTVATRDEK
ncbi:hypothetical protein HIM_06674 [Hirsutella minnesotensis 3608]|uniref:WW domain-containing protein n=1 Tax=Hirsutella minnesotensis 3608 TaxID=1043627 RepID=A0A0F7ZIU6_9HYPO|nr:hypothetical protein HIM_06674 [Hirsutella minnesotensis 3608]